MRRAPFAADIDCSTPAVSDRTTRGFFAGLLEALHRSRRRQALRAIRQYRHLIAQPDAVDATSDAGGRQNADQ